MRTSASWWRTLFVHTWSIAVENSAVTRWEGNHREEMKCLELSYKWLNNYSFGTGNLIDSNRVEERPVKMITRSLWGTINTHDEVVADL